MTCYTNVPHLGEYVELRRDMQKMYETAQAMLVQAGGTLPARGAKVKVSKRNTKLHNVWSLSKMPILTCGEGLPCYKACYAMKSVRQYANTARAYLHNTIMMLEDCAGAYAQVQGYLDRARKRPVAFRFDVAGEVLHWMELQHRFAMAKKNPDIQFLMYTKKYDIVNDYLLTHEVPANLHIVLSVWAGLTVKNPHNLPEAHIEAFGTADANRTCIACIWNCEQCAKEGIGCFGLKNGEQVIFPLH